MTPLALLADYWRSSAGSIYSCLTDGACVGGLSRANNTDTVCAAGHRGNLCEVCKDGYFKFNTCVKCPENMHLNEFLLALTLIVVVLAIFVLVVRNLGTKSDLSITLKITINFVQVLHLVYTTAYFHSCLDMLEIFMFHGQINFSVFLTC